MLLALCILVPAYSQKEQADKDYQLGAFNLAVRNYLSLLEKSPANYNAMSKLADSYRYLNQMEESRSWYEKVIREAKLEGEQMFNYALVLKALGQYDKAQQWFMAYARANREGADKGNHYAQSCIFAKNQLGQSSPYLINNEFINTTASDFGPAFMGDDQLVFSSARSDLQGPGPSWTGKSQNQLYMARISSRGFLEDPVPFRSRLRENFINIGPVSYGPEGEEVAYTKNNFIDGTRHIPTGGQDLSIAFAPINANREWSDEEAFPFNGGSFSTGWPCFSPDGNTLYFASDRGDSFGGFDIYKSELTEGRWGAPENLGPAVNSPGDEISPYFDGEYLYFSSNWHHGMGGYDIFRAEQSAGRWSRIFHLGNLINSSYDDFGFIYDELSNRGYMVSNRPGGKGSEDIYKVFKSADNVMLQIRNASDGTAIPYATVDFLNCGEGVFRADARGNYNFQAVAGLSCDIVIRAEGFNEAMFSLSTRSLRQNRDYDIMLVKQGEANNGQILDYQSRRPLTGVAITSTNQATSASYEATSGRNGEYTLALAPNATYIVRYSRPGYRDINRTINVAERYDPNLLGTISMLPTDSPVQGNSNYIPPRDNSNQVQTRSVEPEAESTAIAAGYAVQVAALSKPGLESFQDLTNVGRVYSKRENGVYKIRVGVFSTQAQARQALGTIKAKGHKEAFLVQESGGETGR
jgi:tetratricopeptide (TPR) repeat protein